MKDAGITSAPPEIEEHHEAHSDGGDHAEPAEA
jgi:hypothetical protein